jgi:hypothetical protein
MQIPPLPLGTSQLGNVIDLLRRSTEDGNQEAEGESSIEN